jgi:hypothetical protein
MRIKFIVIALLIVAMAGIASASPLGITYQIQGAHTGEVTLYVDGTGTAQIGSDSVSFTWDRDQNEFHAHYWIWLVPFAISEDGSVLTSSSVPDTWGILER